jgi:hypothetical protein
MTINEQSVLVFAMRYALGRKTAAAFVVATVIEKKWDQIDRFAKEQIKREIQETEDRTSDWEEVLKL